MGTWLATVRFPGIVRYAEYSTVVGRVCGPLRPSVRESYGRDQPDGDPLPEFPDRPLAPIDDLVLVTVEHEPDDQRWHALYCPNRAMLLGPFDDVYRHRLQDEFDLIRDHAGVRHLCRGAGPRGECGRDVDGEPLGLWFPSWPGMPESPDPPPAPDLFAQWADPDLCRRCLLTWLTRPGDNRRWWADVPESAPRRRWWHFGR